MQDCLRKATGHFFTNEEYVCKCFEVTEAAIERAIRLQGLKTAEAAGSATKAGTGCMGCRDDIKQILQRCARRQYKVHLTEEEYAGAHRIYGTPLPDAAELAANNAAAIEGGPQR